MVKGKHGKEAHDYLRACFEKTCYMTIGLESDGRIVFAAHDHRRLVHGAFEQPPWVMNFYKGARPRPLKEWKREQRALAVKVYKEITVAGQTHRLIGKYWRPVQQFQLVDYLKQLARDERSFFRLVEKRTPCKDSARKGGVTTHTSWDEYSLDLEIFTLPTEAQTGSV